MGLRTSRSDFTELFLAKSLARPQLLFSCREESEVILFSSPQPQNFGENVSLVAINHHVSFPIQRACHISSDDRILKGRKTRELVSVICNPSTRQSFTLPKMKTRKRTGLRSFLGSEKYSFVNLMESGKYDATLINFQGKLASVRSSATTFFSGTSTSLEMYIQEDPEKHEWSKRIFNLPPMWKEAAAGEYLGFVGVTATNEVVISPLFPSDPFLCLLLQFRQGCYNKS
ncbi:hypothetical protein F2Q69_00011549 [Brassica cretica]|uniref:F-box associated beta-propeller type 3 domain-containing protein n=1 Tax=Brassica cretica TaxID=69181 RepID=A0A8S9QQL3_BRACR|nr:hypothetical protein F2Q69_00011549 [Brassica cretica]